MSGSYQQTVVLQPSEDVEAFITGTQHIKGALYQGRMKLIRHGPCKKHKESEASQIEEVFKTHARQLRLHTLLQIQGLQRLELQIVFGLLEEPTSNCVMDGPNGMLLRDPVDISGIYDIY
ncbi:hypothetical protein SUGI_0755000 [Cryptomeria japonica]|uniref:uncharacterized protein LOC131049021 isoform X2 n=1 Tax=Cryptomeria japonica TaxID=3369 RepID=UPI00241481D0|nr:uncharacterized protein LOC131049021 isoform X2 [Cryptomeria japonica]GLJ37222.1 hypothetical protein SUGI_0755000 [Cryptomeria japonica]